MQEPESVDPLDRELEEALRGIGLAPLRRSEMSIGYQAGLRAGRRGKSVWRGAAATAVVMCGVIFAMRHPAAVESGSDVVSVRETAAKEAGPEFSGSYVQLCDSIVDGWMNERPLVPSVGEPRRGGAIDGSD
jgi:hypothetical protein